MGQTENTGHCDGLMRKNGDHIVIDFVCVKGRRVGKSSAFLSLDQCASESFGLPWSTHGYGV
jgi:hypothetical protein